MPQQNQRSYLWVYKLIIKKNHQNYHYCIKVIFQDQQEMITCITGKKTNKY